MRRRYSDKPPVLGGSGNERRGKLNRTVSDGVASGSRSSMDSGGSNSRLARPRSFVDDLRFRTLPSSLSVSSATGRRSASRERLEEVMRRSDETMRRHCQALDRARAAGASVSEPSSPMSSELPPQLPQSYTSRLHQYRNSLVGESLAKFGRATSTPDRYLPRTNSFTSRPYLDGVGGRPALSRCEEGDDDDEDSKSHLASLADRKARLFQRSASTLESVPRLRQRPVSQVHSPSSDKSIIDSVSAIEELDRTIRLIQSDLIQRRKQPLQPQPDGRTKDLEDFVRLAGETRKIVLDRLTLDQHGDNVSDNKSPPPSTSVPSSVQSREEFDAEIEEILARRRPAPAPPNSMTTSIEGNNLSIRERIEAMRRGDQTSKLPAQSESSTSSVISTEESNVYNVNSSENDIKIDTSVADIASDKDVSSDASRVVKGGKKPTVKNIPPSLPKNKAKADDKTTSAANKISKPSVINDSAKITEPSKPIQVTTSLTDTSSVTTKGSSAVNTSKIVNGSLTSLKDGVPSAKKTQINGSLSSVSNSVKSENVSASTSNTVNGTSSRKASLVEIKESTSESCTSEVSSERALFTASKKSLVAKESSPKDAPASNQIPVNNNASVITGASIKITSDSSDEVKSTLIKDFRTQEVVNSGNNSSVSKIASTNQSVKEETISFSDSGISSSAVSNAAVSQIESDSAKSMNASTDGTIETKSKVVKRVIKKKVKVDSLDDTNSDQSTNVSASNSAVTTPTDASCPIIPDSRASVSGESVFDSGREPVKKKIVKVKKVTKVKKSPVISDDEVAAKVSPKKGDLSLPLVKDASPTLKSFKSFSETESNLSSPCSESPSNKSPIKVEKSLLKLNELEKSSSGIPENVDSIFKEESIVASSKTTCESLARSHDDQRTLTANGDIGILSSLEGRTKAISEKMTTKQSSTIAGAITSIESESNVTSKQSSVSSTEKVKNSADLSDKKVSTISTQSANSTNFVKSVKQSCNAKIADNSSESSSITEQASISSTASQSGNSTNFVKSMKQSCDAKIAVNSSESSSIAEQASNSSTTSITSSLLASGKEVSNVGSVSSEAVKSSSMACALESSASSIKSESTDFLKQLSTSSSPTGKNEGLSTNVVGGLKLITSEDKFSGIKEVREISAIDKMNAFTSAESVATGVTVVSDITVQKGVSKNVRSEAISSNNSVSSVVMNKKSESSRTEVKKSSSQFRKSTSIDTNESTEMSIPESEVTDNSLSVINKISSRVSGETVSTKKVAASTEIKPKKVLGKLKSDKTMEEEGQSNAENLSSTDRKLNGTAPNENGVDLTQLTQSNVVKNDISMSKMANVSTSSVNLQETNALKKSIVKNEYDVKSAVEVSSKSVLEQESKGFNVTSTMSDSLSSSKSNTVNSIKSIVSKKSQSTEEVRSVDTVSRALSTSVSSLTEEVKPERPKRTIKAKKMTASVEEKSLSTKRDVVGISSENAVKDLSSMNNADPETLVQESLEVVKKASTTASVAAKYRNNEISTVSRSSIEKSDIKSLSAKSTQSNENCDKTLSSGFSVLKSICKEESASREIHQSTVEGFSSVTKSSSPTKKMIAGVKPLKRAVKKSTDSCDSLDKSCDAVQDLNSAEISLADCDQMKIGGPCMEKKSCSPEKRTVKKIVRKTKESTNVFTEGLTTTKREAVVKRNSEEALSENRTSIEKCVTIKDNSVEAKTELDTDAVQNKVSSPEVGCKQESKLSKFGFRSSRKSPDSNTSPDSKLKRKESSSLLDRFSWVKSKVDSGLFGKRNSWSGPSQEKTVKPYSRSQTVKEGLPLPSGNGSKENGLSNETKNDALNNSRVDGEQESVTKVSKLKYAHRTKLMSRTEDKTSIDAIASKSVNEEASRSETKTEESSSGNNESEKPAETSGIVKKIQNGVTTDAVYEKVSESKVVSESGDVTVVCKMKKKKKDDGKKKESRIERTIRHLRESSVPREEMSESRLLKRATSMEDLNEPKRPQRTKRASSLAPGNELEEVFAQRAAAMHSKPSRGETPSDPPSMASEETISSLTRDEGASDDAGVDVGERIRMKSYYSRFNQKKHQSRRVYNS